MALITGPAKATTTHGTAMAARVPTTLILLVDFMDELRTAIRVPDGSLTNLALVDHRTYRSITNDEANVQGNPPIWRGSLARG